MTKPSWGEWFEDARIKTKGYADRALIIGQAATKIAQEGAVELGKQAKELREKYELDAAASSIMSTLGGAQDNFRFRSSVSKKRSVLDVTYVTENLISMSFPYDYQKVARKSGVVGNDIDAISTFLQQKHGSHYMIWNISEETYDYSMFGDQVLEYNFPGHPSPPLGLLFKICTSVENWLDADEKNVAVLHCLTGKGRTSTVMSCILTWIGEFSTPVEALQYVAERRGVPVEYLTIPSQRRYVQYFTSMFGGLKPVSTPLLLRRVIMTRIPNYSKDPDMQGCCPYIQIFQNGQLVSTAAPRFPEREPQPDTGKGQELQWLSCIEGSASFTLDCLVQGDVLLRCRHAEPSGSRVSILRAAFHTGYITSGILRFEKADLDGACSDSRFHEDFFIDLIFAPLTPIRHEESTPSNPSESNSNPSESNLNSVRKSENENEDEKSCDEEEKKVEMKEEVETIEKTEGENIRIPNVAPLIPLPSDRGLVLDPLSSIGFKDSSDKDFLFWEAVEARKNRSKKKRSRKFASSSVRGHFSISEDVGHSIDSDQGSGHFLKASSAEIAHTSSGVSNEDIIQQIDRLELEESKEEGGGGTELGSERKVSEGTHYDEGEGEGEEGEFSGTALVEYDEDYGMSLGDVYPVEDDFLEVNVMSTNPSLTVSSNMVSPMRRNTTPQKNTKKSENPDEMDDFQFYINSIEEPSVVNRKDAQPSTPSAKTELNGVVALDASAYKENPLRKHIQMSSEKTSVTPPVAASGNTDNNEELDELERYLLRLSTA